MFVKFINENEIEYAPKSFVTPTGETILNFNKNKEVMLLYGYKPLEFSIIPQYDERIQFIKTSYVEEENKVKELKIVDFLPIESIISNVINYVEEWYNIKQQEAVPVEGTEYLVKIEWYNTYSNAYQGFMYNSEQNKEVYLLVLNKANLFTNLLINNIEEFKPFYDAVLNKYLYYTNLRNQVLEALQNTDNPEEIISLLNSLV